MQRFQKDINVAQNGQLDEKIFTSPKDIRGLHYRVLNELKIMGKNWLSVIGIRNNKQRNG